jgi:hypothetical protein
VLLGPAEGAAGGTTVGDGAHPALGDGASSA